MVRKLSLIATLIYGMILTFPILAQEPELRIERFFLLMKAGQSGEAVDLIYGDNPWLAKNVDAVLNVKNRITGMKPLVGVLKNHERLQHFTVGTRFQYYSYLAAFERQPMRFVFEFYRPEDTWMIFGFTMDDKLDDDAERLAKDRVVK